jgi:hypothetical protein
MKTTAAALTSAMLLFLPTLTIASPESQDLAGTDSVPGFSTIFAQGIVRSVPDYTRITAYCEPGKVALSGGYESTINSHLNIRSSRIVLDNGSWGWSVEAAVVGDVVYRFVGGGLSSTFYPGPDTPLSVSVVCIDI